MIYLEHRPPADLAGVLRCVWSLSSASGEPLAMDRVLPDGCVEIVLHLGDPFLRLAPEGDFEEQDRSLVVGPTTRAIHVGPSGAADVLGLRLEPAGARLVLGARPGPLRDQVVEAAAVLGREAGALERDLSAAPNDRRVGSALGWLRRRLRADPSSIASAASDARVGAVVEGLSSGLRVETCAQRAGWSRRTLERRVLEETGLQPKVHARLARFGRAVALALAPERPGWAELSAACGYADQAHFSREFRSLAGISPSRWCAEQRGLPTFLAGWAASSSEVASSPAAAPWSEAAPWSLAEQA